MKIRKVKEEIRVIGVDDSPFIPHTTGETLIFGVIMRGSYVVEGILQNKIIIDGFDATEKIGEMILNSNHYNQIRVIMVAGITFGGFNVVDIDELYKITNLPIISVIDHEPNLNKIELALKKNMFNWQKRWKIFQKIKSIEKIVVKPNINPLYVHYSGPELNNEMVLEILKKTTGISHIPECIRIAHMIGASFKL